MGNTEKLKFWGNDGEDHPHLRGEYFGLVVVVATFLGSPPPTWGILNSACRCGLDVGITPTYVGNTKTPLDTTAENRDHPHLRGEYRTSEFQCPHYTRITPTYVGNTVINPIAVSVVWDHPHLRGEYEIPLCVVRRSTGSPPPTWGIQFR